MESVNIDDLMSFEERDGFWKSIIQNISRAILNNYKFAVIFEVNEIIGKNCKEAEEYNFIIDEDQFEYFLINYLKWSEELERFEECQKIMNLLTFLKNKNEYIRS